MPRNIILCSDGTGNSSGKLSKTNVWRVYQAVDLTDPKDPKQPRQFAFYDNGVGTSSFKPLALLGGALGVGLARNVRDLYAFVCRTYRPGDSIYAFGFSRGAFTIRILVGLMMNQGLVRYDGDESELARHVASAYRAYRRERFTVTGGLVGPIRALRDALIDAWDGLRRRPRYRDVVRIGKPKPPLENRDVGRIGKPEPDPDPPLKIAFIGLWDTVDAYGLPIDELTRAVDWFIWPLTMRDLNLDERVERARHALSLDDERNTFHPRLWNEKPDPDDDTVGVPGGNRDTKHIDDERISQVWFSGVHSNVGGGYPDDSVSFVSLDWIMTEAQKYGLRFSQNIWDAFRALADENGVIYDSRHGVGGYYRYNPRRIEQLTNKKEVTVERTKVHASVFRRIAVGQDGYAPFVLPPGFAVMEHNGAITGGNEYLATDVGEGSRFAAEREHVWNWVWWRRVAYFGTLFATLALLAMPLTHPSPANAGCTPICFVSEVVNAAAAVLPAFTTPWIESFASYPGTFLVLALLSVFGLRAGGALDAGVRDAMRAIWYGIPKTRSRPIPPPAPPGRLNLAIQWLRTRRPYRWFFWFLTQRLLPGVFLVVVVFAGLALLSQATFTVRDALGQVCAGSGPAKPISSHAEGVPFRANALCTPTGLKLEEGATYRLFIVIPAVDPWIDNGIPAGPYGVPAAKASWPMKIWVPFRRHLRQPWLKPIARIGNEGDEYPLDPRPSMSWPAEGKRTKASVDTCSKPPAEVPKPDPGDTTFTAEIVARSSGELFVYLNDAVFFPPKTRLFYCNNEGSGRIAVERAVPRKAP
jgi:uncharacterized protein (DUF2235 family)